MQRTAHNGLVDIDITIPDFKVKAAVRIGANSGFIVDRCSLTAKIRQRYKVSGITFLTLRETELFHGALLPTIRIRLTN